MSQNLCNKPEWLNLDRYNFTKALDGEGWYHEITRRLRYRDLWEREPSEDASPAEHESFQAMRADPERFFEAYLDDVSPLPLEPPSTIGVQRYLKNRIADNADRAIRKDLWLYVPSIDEGEPPLEIGSYKLYRTRQQGSASARQEMLVQLDADSGQRVEVPYTLFTSLVKSIRSQIQERRERLPAVAELKTDEAPSFNFEVSSNTRKLIIDLEASDYEIIEDFKGWLFNQARGALRRRGQKGFKDTYTPAHGHRWYRFRILAILDLEFWFTLLDLERPTQKELTGWLFPELRADACKEEWWRSAQDAKEDALKALDKLAYVPPS